MPDIKNNIEQIKERIAKACQKAKRSPDEVTLVAVSKTRPAEAIETAFEAGQNDFGENRVQEAEEKLVSLSHIKPTWHLIGHLQTNKVKSAVKLFDIIHSVDSIKLVRAISKQADRPIQVLLQVNVAGEESKGGFTAEELPQALNAISELSNIEVAGLMTMAPIVGDQEEARPVFSKLKQLRDSLGLKHLSRGMTDDYEVAIEEGSTMVRIGRAIFGPRL